MDDRLRHCRGQSLVELALLTPFLILVVLGSVDFGRVYRYDIAAINAARCGARMAADVRKQDTDVVVAVQNDASPLVIPSSSITIDPPSARAPGADVTVTVTYSFTPITPLLSRIFPGGVLTISRHASMVAF